MDIQLFLKEMSENIVSVTGGLLTMACLAMVKSIREYIWKKVEKLYDKIKKHGKLVDSITLNRYVMDCIVELRLKLDADRAWVNQFHNGQKFSAQDPVWHISRTYEKCSDGIRYENTNLKHILVSTIFELIECFLKPDSVVKGIQKIDCKHCPSIKKCNRRAFLFDTDDMVHTSEKQLLILQGVKQSIQMNLTNKYDETVGILGIDVINGQKKEDIYHCCQTMQQYAEMISYKLAAFPEKKK